MNGCCDISRATDTSESRLWLSVRSGTKLAKKIQKLNSGAGRRLRCRNQTVSTKNRPNRETEEGSETEAEKMHQAEERCSRRKPETEQIGACREIAQCEYGKEYRCCQPAKTGDEKYYCSREVTQGIRWVVECMEQYMPWMMSLCTLIMESVLFYPGCVHPQEGQIAELSGTCLPHETQDGPRS